MDTPAVQQHYKKIRFILIVILALNWLVALAKILCGLFTRCSSITADGIHSLSDGASNILCLVGIHFASQPVDSDHPYGHRKYETFFSLGIAALLFFVALELVQEGVRRLVKPVAPDITLVSFAIMLATTLINILVMRYEYRKGKMLKSDILVSDSLHTKADIFTSLSVIIALIMIRMGYPMIDAVATIGVALFIAYSGFQIIREASRILCDSAVIMNVKKISDIVLGIKGVKNCHKIRTRGRPDDIKVDLHVQVKADMHVDTAHRVSYSIEEGIKNGIPEVTDVVVHIEPRTKEPSSGVTTPSK